MVFPRRIFFIFVMKVLMISTNRNRLPVPVMPAGACLVAEAVRRAGHEVRLLDLMFEPDPARAIGAAVCSFAPDVAGISMRNIDNNDMQNPRFYAADEARGLMALYTPGNGYAGGPCLRGRLPVVLGGPDKELHGPAHEFHKLRLPGARNPAARGAALPPAGNQTPSLAAYGPHKERLQGAPPV